MRVALKTALALLLFLAAAAPARAALVVDEGASFARADGFAAPTSIAVDDAGRVYVADSGAGRVDVFDSGSGTQPNRYLLSIGVGQLQKPVSVAIDNRQRVYVADAGRNLVLRFDSFFERFRPLGQLAQPGQAPGQLDGPRALTTDPGQKIFVAEAGNLRVSVFRPARANTLVFASAFGVAHHTPPVRRPTAIARDSANRLYLANAEPGAGFIRAVDRRGRFVANLGAGSVSAPQGVAVDRFDRVFIADTGHDRLLLYGPVRRGAVALESFSSASMRAPLALAFAPGSLLYALTPDRVVRLRYDDADRDGVSDSGDNCRGLANGDQDDTDADGRGNACDEDDDGDGDPDGADRCPTERAVPDANNDGCEDPSTRISSPVQGRTYAPAPSRVSGRSNGGSFGVQSVEVAIGRRLDRRRPDAAGARCSWLVPARRAFVRGTCANPRFFPATGTDSWRINIPAGLLSRGSYAVAARAKQVDGPLESVLAYGRNLRVFSVG